MKSRSRRAVAFLLVLLLAMVFAGSCSKNKKDIPVAEVGDRIITLADFEEAYRKISPDHLPEAKGFEGLKEFLNTMINKEVMAIKADELGYDKDPYVVQSMEVFRRYGLQAAYLKFKVGDEVKVTDKDLKEYYKRWGMTMEIKQILVDTEEEAEEVYRLLKEGNDFETICKRYSKAPDADDGGKVLTAKFGNFQPEFQNEIFDLPVGGISRPLPSTYGYFIIKVLKKHKQKLKPFDEMKEEMRKYVKAYKNMEHTNMASEAIREKYGFQWYEENIGIAFEALPPDRPLSNPPPPRSPDAGPILKFKEEDLDKPLVSYKNKSITIKDFSDLYDKSSFFERPRREYRWGGIKGFLIRLVMNELVIDEMEASNVEEIPEVKKVLERKQEELMVSKMFEDLFKQQIVITEAEIKDYYQQHIDSYKIPEKRKFGVILTGDRSSAEEAYTKLNNGEDFGAVVEAYSLDDDTKDRKGETELLAKGEQPELDEVGFGLEKVGDISQPFQISRGWVILKLIEKQGEKQLPFSRARALIERALKNSRSNQRLNEKLEEWKQDIPIKIYEGNLKKAKVKEGTLSEKA